MKAVYERPRVNIEEFAADNAVAAGCGINDEIIFDCLRGKEVDQVEVLSTYFNIANNTSVDGSSCTVQAGFADYAGITSNVVDGSDTLNDNITFTTVDLNNYLSNQHTDKNSWIEFSQGESGSDDTADLARTTSSFLGWFYIAYKGHSCTTTSNVTSNHWSISDGKLTLTSVLDGMFHAALAPVFSLTAITSL